MSIRNWEYELLVSEASDYPRDGMAAMGAYGWELVAVEKYTRGDGMKMTGFHFKRPLDEDR